jgi:hypothetical protein
MFAPRNWGQDCDAEMRRMNDLWNKLVEIDRANSAAYRGLIDSALDPVVSGERDAVLAELEALKAQRKQRHAAARKRVPTPDLDEAIEQVRQRYHALKEQFAAAKKAARATTIAGRRALEVSRQAAVKLARQTSGLYWGNYNAVINSYDATRQKVLKDGGELRFRGFKHEGRIVNQIQGGLTIAGLFDSDSNQVQLRAAKATDWPKRRLHPLGHVLTACVNTQDRKPRHVSWPLILHRPFPDDAIVKEVHISRRRKGPRADQWTVAFSLSVPAITESPAGAACGMDIGWRLLNEGVRVATIVNDRGERDFVVLPERIVAGFRFVDELKARRDQRVNGIVAALKQLPWKDAPSALHDVATAMLNAPRHSASALTRLVALWKEHPWQTDAYNRLREMLICDVRDWRESAGLRLRLVRARRDHYRVEAKRLIERYGIVGSEKLSVGQMSSDANNPTPGLSRWYRRVAAPAEWQHTVKWAAKKAGAYVHEYVGPSTWVCHACGHAQEPRDPAALVASCPHCHTTWDQDVNAAKNLLAAALASAPVLEKDGAALASTLPSSGGGRWARSKKAAAEYRQRSR